MINDQPDNSIQHVTLVIICKVPVGVSYGNIVHIQTGATENTVLIKAAQDRQGTAGLPEIDVLSCIPLRLPWLEAWVSVLKLCPTHQHDG